MLGWETFFRQDLGQGTEVISTRSIITLDTCQLFSIHRTALDATASLATASSISPPNSLKDGDLMSKHREVREKPDRLAQGLR
jgi:hypothetical protein